MSEISELYQSADWKQEKHVPVIEAPTTMKENEPVKVTATVGKSIPHPNTTEHHIGWIELYFLPEGEKFPYFLGKIDLAAHGASVKGPDTSTVYTDPSVTATFRTAKAGKIIATSYCNIHGLWTDEKRVGIA